ncbi:putative Gti1/Pac2 protein [Ordospora pajunii]|uniref:putative Gti1/Pac2 protein n=1 Tax=Ordospora pajunii TaxID=3039483 RepID=UPI0029527638|nr:putative Gti1/Pac2 protein [Ordospora pajunii]KAH9411948.1 putative Gti1/Pac2 protein [Ordospora pajunii]
MLQIESFYGTLENESDCIVLIDMARCGLIPRIQRRLTSHERRAIRHGSVFVYCEEESTIRRWTDDMAWSPSRIQGAFLAYRQMLATSPMIKKTYSATCAGRNFHVVAYSAASDCHSILPSPSLLYAAAHLPTDIRIRKKPSFRSFDLPRPHTEHLETHDDFALGTYWY